MYSDRLLNLNLTLYLQVFLTHDPSSISTSVTIQLFVIRMPSAIQMYLVDIVNHSSLPSITDFVCVWLALLMKVTYGHTDMQSTQSHKAYGKRTLSAKNSNTAKLYFIHPQIIKKPNNFCLEPKGRNKTHRQNEVSRIALRGSCCTTFDERYSYHIWNFTAGAIIW